MARTLLLILNFCKEKQMKIYLNRQPLKGPWGGGNKTVTELSEMLQKADHQVVFRLEDDVDIIFCFDPRTNKNGEWYQHFLNYKNDHPQTKIIQRVGDLGTHGKPELTNLVRQTIQISDYLIFPSKWAKEYIGYEGKNCSVIHNAPLKIFHEYKKNNKLSDSLNIITHHWSTNPKKGFEYYKFLDTHPDEHLNFTFIGRLPKNFCFNNSKHVDPTGDNEYLAKEISKSDIYLTASEEEAGANHVLEAVAAGLPVVYHSNGGSINNYCHEYGLEYSDFDGLLKSIKEVKENYDNYKEKAMSYTRTISDALEEYEEIIYAMQS